MQQELKEEEIKTREKAIKDRYLREQNIKKRKNDMSIQNLKSKEELKREIQKKYEESKLSTSTEIQNRCYLV